jgi:hypothetical protein
MALPPEVFASLRFIQAQGRDRQYPVLKVQDGPETKKTSDPKHPRAVQAHVSRQKQDWLPVLTPVDALYPKSFFGSYPFLSDTHVVISRFKHGYFIKQTNFCQ